MRSSLGQSIMQVQAVDADSVGSVTYSIQSGNRDNAIGINPLTGTLYNTVLMNNYGGQYFDLKLRATDQGTLYHNTTALVDYYISYFSLIRKNYTSIFCISTCSITTGYVVIFMFFVKLDNQKCKKS